MKKGKLVVSIISLCFALAVLTFGVFAAQQVSYQLSGNISYDVSDAYVEIDTKVYQSDAFPESKQDLAVVAGELASTNAIVGEHTKLLDSDTLNTVSGSVSDPYEPISEELDLDFNDTFEVSSTEYNLRSVYIITKITNLASNNVYAVPNVELKNNSTIVDPASYNIVEYMSNGYSVIDQDETVTIILAYTLSDITQNVGELTFDYTINIQAGDYEPEQTLYWDNTLGFFYVKMGTKTISASTYDLRWRLYSIDGGATKYITSSGIRPSEPVGKGVFILEDAQIQNGTTIGNCLIGNCGENNNYVKFNAGETGIDNIYYKSATNDDGTPIQVTDDENTVHTNVFANDYFGSDIFEYLRGDYLGASGANILTGEGTLYNSIKPRTQADLAQDMVVLGEAGGDQQLVFETKAIYNADDGIKRNSQKLWLLSYREALTIICGESGNNWNPNEEQSYTVGIWKAGIQTTGDFGVQYWSRTPHHDDTEFGWGITSGEMYLCPDDGYNYNVYADFYAVRPAFILAL